MTAAATGGGWPLPCIPPHLARPLPHAGCQPKYRHAVRDEAGRLRLPDGRSLRLARSTALYRNRANVPGRNSSHCCSTSGVTDPRSQILSLSPHVSSGQRISATTGQPLKRDRAGRPVQPPIAYNVVCLWTQRDRSGPLSGVLPVHRSGLSGLPLIAADRGRPWGGLAGWPGPQLVAT